MTALLALIRKDLIVYLSDRRALLISLMLPIALASFMGYIFGGSGKKEQSKVEIALVAQDHGAIAQQIAGALRKDENLLVREMDLAQARERVKSGKLGAAVVLPAGFGDAAGAAFFRGGAKPEIPLFYDPSQSVTLAMVKGILTQHVMQAVSAEMFNGKAGQDMAEQGLRELEKKNDPRDKALRDLLGSVRAYQSKGTSAMPGGAGGLSMPFATRDEALSSGPKYNGYAHAFAGMGVQFILFLGIDVGIGVLLARRAGIWNRLEAAPVPLSTILLARALSCAVIAFGLLCVIFAAAALLFGVRFEGGLAGFAGVGVCFALMTAAFGLCIAAFGKTPEAARGIALFVTLVMVMLGGAWVPSFIFPQWLQSFTLVMPTRWAVDGFDAMTWRGLGMDAALSSMAVQLGFTLLFGALALWKFRREGR